MAKAMVATSNQTVKTNLHNRFLNQKQSSQTAVSKRAFSRDFDYLSAILILSLPLNKVIKSSLKIGLKVLTL